MRDAFGGLFMLRLLLVFIFIYLVFAAISYNYAQAFRLKNSLITYLEEQDVFDFNTALNAGDGEILNGIDEILNLSTYRVTCSNGNDGLMPVEDPLDPQKFCYHGVVIRAEEQGNIINYDVSTFVYWNIPLLNTFILHAANSTNADAVENAAWEITGNAKVVKRTDPEEQSDVTNQKIIDDYHNNNNNNNASSGLSNNKEITDVDDNSAIEGNTKRKYNDDPTVNEYTWEEWSNEEATLKTLKNYCKNYNGEYVDHEYVYKRTAKGGTKIWDVYLYCR